MGKVPERKIVKKYKEKVKIARREGYLEACTKLMKLFDIGISQQVIDYYDAGLDVKMHVSREYVKASELLSILRGE